MRYETRGRAREKERKDREREREMQAAAKVETRPSGFPEPDLSREGKGQRGV